MSGGKKGTDRNSGGGGRVQPHATCVELSRRDRWDIVVGRTLRKTQAQTTDEKVSSMAVEVYARSEHENGAVLAELYEETSTHSVARFVYHNDTDRGCTLVVGYVDGTNQQWELPSHTHADRTIPEQFRPTLDNVSSITLNWPTAGVTRVPR